LKKFKKATFGIETKTPKSRKRKKKKFWKKKKSQKKKKKEDNFEKKNKNNNTTIFEKTNQVNETTAKGVGNEGQKPKDFKYPHRKKKIKKFPAAKKLEENFETYYYPKGRSSKTIQRYYENGPRVRAFDESWAKLGAVRGGVKKLLPFCRMLKGLNYEEALNQCKLLQKRMGPSLVKLLQNAAANAVENYQLNPKKMFVSEIWLERITPLRNRVTSHSKGRVGLRLQRRSNIRVILRQVDVADDVYIGRRFGVTPVVRMKRGRKVSQDDDGIKEVPQDELQKYLQETQVAKE